MPPTAARSLWLSAGLLAIAGTSPAWADVQIPAVVVTSPTPGPAKPQPKPAVTAKTAPAAPDKGEPLPPPQVSAPLRGTLVVVDTEFAPTTVATDAELAASGGATLADMLQSKPGLTASNFAAGASRPIIRGLDNFRVRVQENGIGTHDASNLSEDHAVPIDPNAARQVEVIRGPATLRYGSQGIGGVVSVDNDRIPSRLPDNGANGSLRGGLGAADRSTDGAFDVTAGAAGVAVHADGFARHSGDYDTPAGRQVNSFVDSNGLAFGGSLIGTSGYLGLSFSRIDSLYGIPGIAAAAEHKRIDMTQDKVLAMGELRIADYGIDAVRFWLGTSSYAHNELSGAGEIGSRFTNREGEARIELQHARLATGFGHLSGTAGIQIDDRNLVGRSFDGDSLLDPTRSRSMAAYLFEELKVSDRLRLQGAVRAEWASARGDGLAAFANPALPVPFKGERTFRPVSASAGLLYALPLGLVARLTGQFVERAPDAAELYSKGAHEATGTFEIGDPNLKTEAARSLEVGLARAHGDLRLDATAYYTAYDGFIFKRLTGVTCGGTLASCGVDTELKQLVFAQRDATFYGAELSAQYDVAPLWRGVWGIDGRFDVVHATFDGAGYVPRIPPVRLGGGLYYRDAHWLAKVSLLHAFAQNDIAASETPTSGYTRLDAELSTTFERSPGEGAGTETTLGIKGENLLDADIRNHVSFKKDEVLEPGRTVRLFAITRF